MIKNMKNYLVTHKWLLLSGLLMFAAAVLGAGGGVAMAMAVDVNVDDDGKPVVQTEESLRAGATPDHMGLETQLPGKAATATDVRDAGFEAEDLDPRVVDFRPFQFSAEWYFATKCRQVKVNSYVVSHARSGATLLEDTLNVEQTGITAKAFTIPCANFENDAASLTEYAEVFVQGVDGYAEDGKTLEGGLVLYVLSNDDENVKLIALNPGTSAITIPAGTKVIVGAPICSESQMRVPAEAYLPEKVTHYLQKKAANVIITDEWNEMAKKVSFIKQDVLHNGLYNFKRKCAYTHWLGTQKRIDVKVKELGGNIEAGYSELGVLRQIPTVYSYNGKEFTTDDLLGISKLQFATNSFNNHAVAFCGTNALERLQKLFLSLQKNQGNLEFREIPKTGIIVRGWKDMYGEIEFVRDPSLDAIGYGDFIAVLDIDNAVRYYKRNEQEVTQDLKKTGESREAERTIITMIDCICLKGYNAVLVTPASKLSETMSLGGVSAVVEKLPVGLSSTDSLDKTKRYYCTYTIGSFNAGSFIEYDATKTAWKEVEGEITNV